MDFIPTVKAMAIRKLPPTESREQVAYRVDINLGDEFSTCVGPYTWSTPKLAKEHAQDIWRIFVKHDLETQAT